MAVDLFFYIFQKHRIIDYTIKQTIAFFIDCCFYQLFILVFYMYFSGFAFS